MTAKSPPQDLKILWGRQSTVLIVDDEIDLLEVIRDSISQYFEEVLVAASGREALKILEDRARSRPVDAMVTDFRMPEMDGLRLIAEARKQYPDMPITMLTANGSAPEVLEALGKGAFDVLDKPFRTEVLVNRVLNSLLYPRVRKILWDLLGLEFEGPKLEEVAKLPFSEQLKALDAVSALLSTRALNRSMRSTSGSTGKS